MINTENYVSEKDREWIKKYDQLRIKLDENQSIINARAHGFKEGYEQEYKKGFEIGLKQGTEIGEAKKEKEMIITLFQSGMPLEQIATMIHKDVSYVKNIVKNK